MLFPELDLLRVLVVANEPTEGLAAAARLDGLTGPISVGTALPDSMAMSLRLREPALILSIGPIDLSQHDPPVVALVEDSEEGRRAFEFGARGVLLRGADPSRIEAALRAVEAGLRVVGDGLELPPAAHSDSSEGFAISHEAPVLTPREREVLDLLAEGLSNRDIAAELEVSERTAKFHVAGLLKKLDARTRTEAVVRAARKGLLLLHSTVAERSTAPEAASGTAANRARG